MDIYLILIGTSRVPYLLHHLDCLFVGNNPRVLGLTDKGDIRRDECLPEPFHTDGGRNFFSRSFLSFLFPFAGIFAFGWGNNMLDWG